MNNYSKSIFIILHFIPFSLNFLCNCEFEKYRPQYVFGVNHCYLFSQTAAGRSNTMTSLLDEAKRRNLMSKKARSLVEEFLQPDHKCNCGLMQVRVGDSVVFKYSFFSHSQLVTTYKGLVPPCRENVSNVWGSSSHTVLSERVKSKARHLSSFY